MKHIILSAATALLLAACNPSEPQPQAAAEIQTASAEAPASSVTETAASEAAASAAQSAAERLDTQANAKWQQYQCDEQKTLSARYFKDGGNTAAQIKTGNATHTLALSPELGNEDLSAFSNGEYTWTIGKLTDDYYQEGYGFFVRHSQVEGMGEEGIVDELQAENCMPPSTQP
ncbi:MliC family protein [Neisseria lisongii]|uniref:MliC family protein n=1 Tax=Neisseria lisongii TaxID=2912188 RepID=A0AAW5ALE8_9NEIS|nr:MliC family protein [Neisseria lisongii]MCF7530351.1 MliC family protein [Neisseria lisongii]